MARMEEKDLSQAGKKLLSCIEFDQNEQLIFELHKHVIGLVMVYLVGGFVTVLMFGLALASMSLNGDSMGIGIDLATMRPIAILVTFILMILSLVATAIAGHLYRSNVIIVTSEKIAQFLYPTIFNRKISQLSIGDVQDVTVNQVGILPQMFNFGTIVIETAGEQDNYIFSFAPHPYESSKAIVGAHERNLQQFGN